jgi:hypothetical protein
LSNAVATAPTARTDAKTKVTGAQKQRIDRGPVSPGSLLEDAQLTRRERLNSRRLSMENSRFILIRLAPGVKDATALKTARALQRQE